MKNTKPLMIKIFVVIGIIIVVLGASYFFLDKYLESPDLTNSIKQQLIELVDKKSKGLYHLNIGSISLDGTTSSALITNITLSVDSIVLAMLIRQKQQPASIYGFTLERLALNKADVLAFISKKTAKIRKIDVSSGTLTISSLVKDRSTYSRLSQQNSIRESVNATVDGLQVDTLHADNIDILYTNFKKQSRSIKNVYLDLYQLAIDSAALTDSSRIFLSKKMRLSIDSIRFPLANNLYQFGAKKFVVLVGDSSITSIQDLYLLSTQNLSLEKLAAGMGVQKDVFSVKVKEVMVDNLNLQAMLEDSSIQANLVLINEPEITVFHDNSLKPSTESKIGKYPHQVLRQIPFSIDIPIVLVQGGKISYAEKNVKGDGIGKIHFGQVTGKIGPVNNGRTGSKTIKANFTALFMNSSGMSAHFEFPAANDGKFLASAQFSPFPVTIINEAALPLGNTRLKEGIIKKLNFTVRGNNYSATGTTLLNYEHLNIEVLKGNTDEGFKKNKLLSMVANKFLLHENNRAGDQNKDAFTVTYKRVHTKSFFNLIWKTVFYSIKANTGIGARGNDRDRARIH
ncbi:hypothetical protein [Flavihumibacter fluvii]|uniref:hypothetical protein n=1 Tax=Flavihumibacter fluvii TaxID=2838157 RepID=UPI001BDF1EFC|nr:hypothetical protein [Flavihumibacter fluvii]ULQ53523.1 hypothetical protein KJS93_04215 [Flavihumibacter fluvii]